MYSFVFCRVFIVLSKVIIFYSLYWTEVQIYRYLAFADLSILILIQRLF